VKDVFGSTYAQAYDDLYKDKDYVTECALLDRLCKTYGNGLIHRILDLGCGTGNHALPLARLGYQVVGVDRSGGMLESARKKALSQRLDQNARFHQGDIGTFQIDQFFDASLMMFAVLGYQLSNEDVLSALRTARKHMNPGGILIFDVWYGPAVLREGPVDRIKTIPTENGKILRVAGGKLDVQRHLCQVSYHLWRIESERVVGETEEVHLMRYFFPLELKLFLETCNFNLVEIRTFPEFDRQPDENSWNICAVARAV